VLLWYNRPSGPTIWSSKSFDIPDNLSFNANGPVKGFCGVTLLKVSINNNNKNKLVSHDIFYNTSILTYINISYYNLHIFCESDVVG